ncbi:MAG: zeta toxin family protein [Bacteroidales bacterium]|nr:zeta toxin family protein [Bacteroidales bacterium]
MKGDILIIDDNHRKAAAQVVKLILQNIKSKKEKYVITVAGESGAGKSEVAASIAEKLKEFNIKSFIFGQDDYFVLPPKTNENKRKEDISWVGMQEVKLDLLDQNLEETKMKGDFLTKPLVDFNADKIGEETVNLDKFDVLIAEGTYTTSLKNTDCKVFIDRNKMDTVESRKKRAREAQDEFLDNILTIEHKIISKHKDLADIIITKKWDAAFQ